ncbi:MAG TPA: hypothetical protein VNH18_05670 [Bryobacteraceae bacterium]|nr:hypothetical protein [Bryobacteraceae bacterium]
MFPVSPNTALGLTAVGALGVCWEFIRPGTVIPGVTGSLLVVFGCNGLWRYPLDWRGAALAMTAFALFGLEARYRWRSAPGVAGAAALAVGTRILVIEPQIQWVAAIAVAIPFSGLMSFLLTVAWRARVNKRSTIF